MGLSSAAKTAASRGNDVGHRGNCLLAGRLSAGKGNRRLRRGGGDGGAVRVIAGPIVSMQEITIHGDATRIRRNR
ncbi:hypothetical protein BHE74_00044808 [Ensete ventricosum]|nr:hypothetical protein BHE74_00044808 [Ensete ventricosum]